jgi:class 3 adenylate cyclase
MGDEPELRISDADRNAVVDQLSAHTAEGRLTLDEFSDRVEMVLAARTASDLRPALHGLPALSPVAAADASPPERGGKEKRRWVVAVMGGNDRKGRWRVGRRTTAVALMGGVTLDLRGATLDTDDIEIRCWVVMGGIEVIVPEGIPVDFDGFVFMGGRDENVAEVPALAGAPTIRIRGYGLMGGIEVRSRGPHEKRAHRAPGHGPVVTAGSPVRPPPLPPVPPVPPVPPSPTGPPAAAAPSAAPAPPAERAEPGQPPTPPPVGTVTILVTDIVGSTALAERLGDQRWLGVLQSHNALVREQLARHGGTEIKQSGDGFLATFPSSRAGVRAAIEISRSMDGYRRGHPDTPLELRIGVHAGEVERDGGDVFGVNVSTASRIAGAASPGEVLVSGVVCDLADSTTDLRFGEPREVQLAGLSAALRVHSAHAG